MVNKVKLSELPDAQQGKALSGSVTWTGAFVGNLAGNASTASVASLANTLTSIDDTSTSTCYVTFALSSGTTAQAMRTNPAFLYDASTNIITAGLNGNAATVSTSNEASDTTCFLAFFTASGTGNLSPKNNTNLRYNASTNLLAANLMSLDNGGAALTQAVTPLTFGSALGNGTYINYGGTARNTGVTDTGALFHARNAFFNATSANYLYGASGSGVTLLELSDTAINLKYAASGTLGNPITFTTGLSLSQSTGLVTVGTANINNGIAALTGTNAALIFGATNALGDGNYINFGTGGRNIGVFNLGAFFIANNADYNATSDVYKYNSSAGATMMEFTTTSIDFKYAASGTAGNTITTATSLSLSQANGNVTASTGHLIVNTAGKTLEIKEGANACKGTGAVLVAGTVTVSTTAAATGDQIIPTCTAAGGTQGTVRYSIVNNTSFTLTSSNPLDTSTYSWLIVKPA